MTVYESLAVWLNDILSDPQNEFSPVPVVIDLELVPNFKASNGWQDTALFSNPNDLHFPMNGGQTRHVVTKTWYIKRDFLEFPSRLETERFMERLRKAIHKKALGAQYPNDGRTWRKISVEGGVFPYQRAENLSEAIYQVTLRLEYIE